MARQLAQVLGRAPAARMRQEQDVVPLRGGLDLVTPAMLVQPGFCIAAQNYEVEARGYRRLAGFERFDGQPKPSDAKYYVLDFDQGTVEIAEGDTVTGASSGDTGLALVDAVVESGSYAGGDAAGYLVLHALTAGTFDDDENLQVGGATRAVADGTAELEAADSDADHNTWIEAVTALRRAAIGKPSGSGPIRGVATYKGDIYCWRDNAGGTEGQMFKATAAGWALQSLGDRLPFESGVAEPAVGDTIQGDATFHTATIERVVRRSGAWDGSAEGYFLVSGAIGIFTGGESLQVGGVTKASCAGFLTPNALLAGGTYRWVVENFYGQEEATRLYAVNGVGHGFEWDGTLFAPILTGLVPASGLALVTERPTHIGVRNGHLFLGYMGGSLQHSGPGEPLVYDASQGAGEIAFGQEITGLKSTRSALVIGARSKIGYLTGTSAADFALNILSDDSGVIADTLQIVGTPLFLDDQGVRDLQAAEIFGDWKIGTKTRLIEPLLARKRDAGAAPVGSLRVRAKDQYRLLYDDGTGIIVYFGRRDPEVMYLNLGVVFSCLDPGEDSDGNEILLAGGEDGWVYQIDRGTSFDGEAIEAYIRFSWQNQRAPNVEKRYHRGRIEGQAGARNSALAVSADFSYGSEYQAPSSESTFAFEDFTFHGGGGFWEEDDWDRFNWSVQAEGQSFFALDGIGENVSVIVMSDTATEEPHTLSTLTVFWTPRRMQR